MTREESNARWICCPMCDKRKCEREADDCDVKQYMAIRSLEMQKKLAEFRGMDICKWVEDYDYDEDNTSEYEFEASVDDFLIDESKEEVEKWKTQKEISHSN